MQTQKKIAKIILTKFTAMFLKENLLFAMEYVLAADILLSYVMENMVNSMGAVIIPNADLQKIYINNSIKHHFKTSHSPQTSPSAAKNSAFPSYQS